MSVAWSVLLGCVSHGIILRRAGGSKEQSEEMPRPDCVPAGAFPGGCGHNIISLDKCMHNAHFPFTTSLHWFSLP